MFLGTLRPIFIAALSLALSSSLALSAERSTEHTLKLAAGEKPAAASAADMAWLAGRWVGTGLGGECEEFWAPPRDGRMLGTFTLSKQGKPVFYELMLVAEIDGQLMVRLKHFNPDLSGWEDKDKFVDFKFVAKQDGAMYFSGLTYLPDGPDGLKIYLALRNQDGTVREQLFTFRRAP